MNNRNLAKQMINERYLALLEDLRKQLSSSIRERCKLLNHEDKVVYPDIQNKIKSVQHFLDKIYRFAECSPTFLKGEHTLRMLKQKQKLNREAYMKLSDEQAKEKACLAEVNREISKLTNLHSNHNNESEMVSSVNLFVTVPDDVLDTLLPNLIFHFEMRNI